MHTFVSEWRKEQDYFVAKTASLEVTKLLETSSCVVVTGCSGSGKSSIIYNTALYLHDQGYSIHIVEEPLQIFQNHKLEKKTVFVIDDPFGKCKIDHDKINKWKNYEDKLNKILQIETKENMLQKGASHEVITNPNTLPDKTIILISCRLNIYKNRSVSQIAESLKFQECDLSSIEMCLTLSEKHEMFAKYIKNVKFESVKCDMDYFPFIWYVCFHVTKKQK